VVADRKVGREQGDFVRHRLQAVAAAAHDLEDVGVFLVGHDARSRGEVVGQRHEAEILAHEETYVHRKAAYGGGDGRDGAGRGAFALAAAHLRRHDVVVERFEAHQTGGHRAVERERRAVSGGRAERVLVGDMPCGGNQPHVVYERLGIGAEPESERRGHGDLQVGVPRHQHLLVLFAQALQPVEQRFYGVGCLAQFVAQEKFEVHQHLIVARAARMDLLARVAQPPREHQLHLRVDVLGVRLDREASGFDLGGDLFQSGGQLLQFGGGQQPDLFEHGDVGQRPLDVLLRQPHVQFAVVADGIFLDHLVGLEALVPKFGCHSVCVFVSHFVPAPYCRRPVVCGGAPRLQICLPHGAGVFRGGDSAACRAGRRQRIPASCRMNSS